MKPTTFFFYDLETTGLDPREDRIMQFAGQRTDQNLNPIGAPVNLLVKIQPDVLPNPTALAVTKISPQDTMADGLTEPEFCREAIENIFTENTIALGYNTVRFDDEFMRFTFWRNFHDPYEWQWKNGRSRWDLLDVVRFVRALRPEGINWPFYDAEKNLVTEVTSPSGEKNYYRVDENGQPTSDLATPDPERGFVENNRLEFITKLNGVKHEHAHDALSDVYATISVARLLREKQPKMFDYLLNMRNKKSIQALLEKGQPFVYASGRISGEHHKTSVVASLGATKNGKYLVYDLRHNPTEVLNALKSGERKSLYGVAKELATNKCPAIAPLGTLEQGSGWEKLGLTADLIREHLNLLRQNRELIDLARKEFAEKSAQYEVELPPEDAQKLLAEKSEKLQKYLSNDPETKLYDGFINDQIDKQICAEIRSADSPTMLRKVKTAEFGDPRLKEMFLHYKGRNFPELLSEEEHAIWEKYRQTRLQGQEKYFVAQLQSIAADPANSAIVEDLKLYYESLAGDY